MISIKRSRHWPITALALLAVSITSASMAYAAPTPMRGRYVRIELPGVNRVLSLAEVEVLVDGVNVAINKTAQQSSTWGKHGADLAVDGNTQRAFNHQSVTHTHAQTAPWWEVDLGETVDIDRIRIHNRQALGERLDGFIVQVLSDQRELMHTRQHKDVGPITNIPATLLDLVEPDKTWTLAGQVEADQGTLKTTAPGHAILINGEKKNTRAAHLKTWRAYGDVSLKMSFMIPKGSNSGVYFMGRYEIQIFDSFGKASINHADLGSLYERWADGKGFEGVPATVNAAKAPGAWQTLEVLFRAPRFDDDGTKISHTQFIDVRVNGQRVLQDVIAKGPTRSAMYKDEQPQGPLVIQGDHGPIAIRDLTIQPVDLSGYADATPTGAEIAPLAEDGTPKIDRVAAGQAVFENKGCVECHAVDTSTTTHKTGPSLYGLLRRTPKRHAVIETAENHAVEVLVDAQYIHDSVRDAARHVAYNSADDNKPYLPIMPSYSADLISDSDLDAIVAYLKTLNEPSDRGPRREWIKKPAAQYLLNQDRFAVWVGQTPRLQRVDLGEKHSARTYHVGLPGEVNYSFDPRTLAIADVWSGPFLSTKNEQDGRARKPSARGHKARVWTGFEHLFQPLYQDGTPVDFSFKEPAHVDQALGKSLVADTSDYVATVTRYAARFLGVDTPRGENPAFRYQVEKNHITLRFQPKTDMGFEARFDLSLSAAQSFRLPAGLADAHISAGEIRDDIWTIPAGEYTGVVFKGRCSETVGAVHVAGRTLPEESWGVQPLTWHASKQKADLPLGYTLHDAETPADVFGRPQLFEPMGIDFLNEEVAFVATRTAGIWKIVNNQWHYFAEGVFETLGVAAESEHSVVIGEKPGLTRLIDRDGDHWAERRENVSDEFRITGNYHEYLHGPIRHDDSYLYALNLAHNVPGNYKAGGQFMGTVGGLRGWLCAIDDAGRFSTFANGLRSPAGLAVSPSGHIIYTENQGEYVGTSKIFRAQAGKFYGNPTGMIDLPGMNDQSPEVQWETLQNKRERPWVLLPHKRVMNAPGNPTWDTTGGKFGPFTGQMLLGDQTLSNIYRIDTEEINGVTQGVALPFVNNLPSGVMRLAFSPADHALWLGQTGRGWAARGGKISALQKITWDGRTPDAIQTVNVTPTGFEIVFTQPQTAEDFGAVAVDSWHYRDSPSYGSDEMNERTETVTAQTWSPDRQRCTITLDGFAVTPKSETDTSRVYRIDLQGTHFGKRHGSFQSQAFYTLHAIPDA